MNTKKSIEKAISILEREGYLIFPPSTPERIKEVDKYLDAFEESEQQFPDELFSKKENLAL